VTIWIISSRGQITQEEKRYRQNLHKTPEIDRDHKKTRLTLLAPALLVVYGCLMPVLLIVYYVFPYQTGAGLLASDGGINWTRGEAILALGSALLYIPLGCLPPGQSGGVTGPT
jgi:sodium/pantothenate symporter